MGTVLRIGADRINVPYDYSWLELVKARGRTTKTPSQTTFDLTVQSQWILSAVEKKSSNNVVSASGSSNGIQ